MQGSSFAGENGTAQGVQSSSFAGKNGTGELCRSPTDDMNL
jgi:hypothetical protein